MADSAAAPRASDTALWRLRLLGAFELDDGRQRHTKLATRAAMALLARLALKPGATHPREELVELLWPGVAAEPGRQRLRQTLSTLRQVLEPASRPGFVVIDADRQSLRLVAGTLDCDVQAFEQAAQRGALEQSHALYRGELLPGFYDEWINDERLRLEGLFDRLPPLPKVGTAAGATVVAAAPAPAHATTAPEPARASLPAYLTPLVGAEEQVRRLADAVRTRRLVSLLGPGGAGKTRLAVETARRLATAGFDWLAFIPLARCSNREQLLDQLLQTLRLSAGASSPLDAVVTALDGRRALLVLDNLEQAIDAAADVAAELAERLPRLHLLATSRRALSLPGEQEISVAALALPAGDLQIAQAAAIPAVALFVERARAARAEFHLHDGNLAAVIELVRRLDGMPLAIELAAARVRSHSPAQMAGLLAGDGSTLDLLARPAAPRQDTRHQSMERAIDWSWQLLAPPQRELLSALAVFEGGFSADAAAAVCGSDTATSLEALIGHSLVRAGPAPGPDRDALRFALSEPIREFAERAAGGARLPALRRAHRAWAAAWVRARPPSTPLSVWRAEMPNLIAAMTSGVADGDAGATADVAAPLQQVFDEIGLPGPGLAALERALDALADEAPLKSRCLIIVGRHWMRGGRGAEGFALVERGVATAQGPEARARALMSMLPAAWDRGRRGEPIQRLVEEALALASEVGDARLIASAEIGVALVVAPSDPARAEQLFRSALPTRQREGDLIGLMRARYGLAVVAYGAGRPQEAVEVLTALAADAREAEAWLRLARALNLRAAALMKLERWSEALIDLRRSLRAAWDSLMPSEAAYAVWNLPEVLTRLQRSERAQTLLGFIRHWWSRRMAVLTPVQAQELDGVQLRLDGQLQTTRRDACLAHGQAMSLAEAVALALDE